MWLGFIVDVGLGQIEVPIEKIEALPGAISPLSCSKHIQARKLASILGRIVSMGLAFGTMTRFMTRSLYAVLESRMAWCEVLPLSNEALEELEFWSQSLECYNARPIWHTPSAVRVVYADASETGYGGYVVEWSMVPQCHTVSGLHWKQYIVLRGGN